MNRRRTWAEIIARPFWWLTSILLGPMSSWWRRAELERAEALAYQEEEARERRKVRAAARREMYEALSASAADLDRFSQEAMTRRFGELAQMRSAGLLSDPGFQEATQRAQYELARARREAMQQQAPRRSTGTGGLGSLLGGGMMMFGRWIPF